MRNCEILINSGTYESRVAILELGVLQEVHVERKSNLGLVGNIYKGKVVRVLPGMDACFIDIGLEKNAFLHLKNIVEYAQEVQQNKDSAENGNNVNNKVDDVELEKPSSMSLYASDKQGKGISHYVRQGQSLLVQVLKDPIGNKGARLTTDISIPSRYIVFLPNSDDIGVSIRIEDEDTRKSLRDAIGKFSNGLKGGYIVRTAIEGTSEWAMHSDIQYLQKIWKQIEDKSKSIAPANLIYSGLPLHLRVIRDFIDDSIASIRIDSKAAYDEMVVFANDFYPDSIELLQYYQSNRPIFDLYSIDDEIEKSLKRKVDLKSGGHIVIDQTEAMTTIDVNTGRFVGLKNHEETIFKTNLEASKAIARQLRLRNLGGIVIIDFIDMESEYHKTAVLDSLTEAMDAGYCRYAIEPISPLGLVTLTRKRTRESLGHILCEACPVCSGRGYIKTVESIVYEIMREIMREVSQFRPKELMVITSYDINNYLTEEEPNLIADLEENLQTPIKLQPDSHYERENYDIALL